MTWEALITLSAALAVMDIAWMRGRLRSQADRLSEALV